MARLHLLVTILHLALTTGSQSLNHTVPPLPSKFYSGYVEEISTREEQELKETLTTVSLKWIAYNTELQLLREDSFDTEGSVAQSGAVSRIEDWNIGVVYTINRRSRNCLIKSLYENNTAQSVEGDLHMRTLQETLLTSTLNYSYEGSKVIRSAAVDVWSSCHNLTNNDSEVMIAFTRPGTPVRNIFSKIEDPILWQFSMRENHSSGDFSTVLNFFDSSYEKPDTDVFDTSACFSSEDYKLLTIEIPGVISEVDEMHFQSSIRSAVANYTGVYLLQIGNIKIISENEGFIFASLQLSNLTPLARISQRISANDALQAISSNLSSSRRLPFPVELSPGVQVFPILHTNPNINLNSYFEESIYPLPSVTSTRAFTSTATSSPTYSQTSDFSVTSTTDTMSVNSPSPTPSTMTVTSFHSFSTICTLPPSNTPQTIVHTVTKTIACSPQPTRAIKPSLQPHVSTICPPSRTNSTSPCAHGLSTGGAVGIAIGAFAGGIIASFLMIVLCVVCCNCCHHHTMKSEGWQQVPKTNRVSKEMDYFQ